MSKNPTTHYNLRSRKEAGTSESGEDISPTRHPRQLSIEPSSESKHIEPEMAEANRTLKEPAAPTFVQQPLYIQYPQLGIMQQVKACEICSIVENPTKAYPTLQEGTLEQANAIRDFQCKRDIDMIHNTYNPGLRNHPNLSYRGNHFIAPQSQFNHPSGFNQERQPQHSQPRQQTPSQSSEMSLEDMVKSLASSTM